MDAEDVAELLRRLYRTLAALGVFQNPLVESYLSIDPSDVPREIRSRDDDAFDAAKLFIANRETLVMWYRGVRGAMRAKLYSECTNEIETLGFLQLLTARAMWQHKFDVGSELESFARRYDRLDQPDIREELYLESQIDPLRGTTSL